VNSSAAGKRAEAKVREDLIGNGYRLVTAHLSRGPADLMAGKPGQTLAVQVKRSARSGGGIGVVEWNDLVDHAEAFDALPVVAVAAPRCPVVYWRITGRKDGSGRRQPWVRFALDFADGVAS